MLFGAADGALEVRRQGDGSVHLAGTFPYNRRAVLSDGGRRGRPRKESFASRAFAYNVERKDVDISFLFGHDFNRVLASRKTGTLDLTDSDDALRFTARLLPEVANTSHGRDALALLTAGLAVGISPGFRIPPERTVPDAEKVEEEDPAEGSAIIRTIMQALLYELSIVVRPAYEDATVEMRRWEPDPRPVASASAQLARYRALRRWVL